LITELAARSGIDTPTCRLLAQFPMPDQARYVERHLSGGESLARAVAALIKTPRASLSHTLLAGLPVREVVTTNNDELFEVASPSAEWEIAQPPYEPDPAKPRWILKLHGTVAHPPGRRSHPRPLPRLQRAPRRTGWPRAGIADHPTHAVRRLLALRRQLSPDRPRGAERNRHTSGPRQSDRRSGPRSSSRTSRSGRSCGPGSWSSRRPASPQATKSPSGRRTSARNLP
jgi:hypothetical protein